MKNLTKSLLLPLFLLMTANLHAEELAGQYSSFDVAGAVGHGKYSGSVSGNHIQGKAISGERKGKQLNPVIHGNHFAFAWFSFFEDSED